MDTAQWPQEIVVKPIEEIVVRNTTCPRPGVDHERKPRPEKEQALNCPRCHSTNTKFCYYNNYSLTQPRYFCKTCRRYWTQGGSLRNIPVGGGSRKNKRSSYNSSSSSSSIIIPPPPKNIKLSTIIPHNNNCCNDNNTPSNKLHGEGQDLNLSFPNISELLVQQNNNNTVASASASSSSSTTTTTTTSHHHHNHHNNHNFSALELITGITTTTTSKGLINNTTTFMPIPPPPPSSSVLPTTHDDPNINMGYTTFPLVLHHHDFKPSSLNFSLDGICGSTSLGFGSLQEDTTSGGRILFPFEDLKHVSTTTMDQNNDDNNNNKEQQQEDHSTGGGYWTGMLGGGSW